MRFRMASVAVMGLCLAACATSTTERLNLEPLRTVESVDLDRYMGRWYEIASFPQSFQEGCTHTTATYSLNEDGEVDVVNRCRRDGEVSEANGTARVVNTTSPAKLEVTFFWPFWGDYWIIDLGKDYEYAVVGHPSRDYLWILSRTPTMVPERYAEIVGRLDAVGYETGRLVETAQDEL